jgi:dihydroorotase
MTSTLTIRAPDDWHCHLRDNPYLAATVPIAAKQFKRAIVMPNLSSPITNSEQALEYYHRILSYVPDECDFTPLMTLYLTDHTTSEMIRDAKASEIVKACKLYPMHVTTNSDHGVSDIKHLYPVFEALQKLGMPLLVHGEVNDPHVDIFDREKVFIDTILVKIVKDFPALKIVLEHITTRHAVEFIRSMPAHIAATITPHHLYVNRNAMLVGGIRPHYYCLPILKRREDQQALIQAAISGSKQFFIGTDSAPHAKSKKETSCGCAGIFHPNALSIYATVFEAHNALDKLEGFTSCYGAEFYGLPLNDSKVILQKNPCSIPENIIFDQDIVIPFLAGETLTWEVAA